MQEVRNVKEKKKKKLTEELTKNSSNLKKQNPERGLSCTT